MIYYTIYNSAGSLIDRDLTRSEKIWVGKNLEIVSEKGINYNGFGYSDTAKECKKMTRSQIIQFNKLSKKTKKPIKTEQEKIENWAKRLSKLTSITYEEALIIADEKKDYQDEQVAELEERQSERYSIQRQKLINKIEKSNPLRYIKNSEHAKAIIIASDRHHSNYDNLLEEGRELVRMGEIENAKDYARANYER